MAKPATPQQIRKMKGFDRGIPSEVFVAFNELILKNFSREGGGMSHFEEKEVVGWIQHAFQQNGKRTSREEIYQKGWLEVKDHYEKAGWDVRFDPGSGAARDRDLLGSFSFTAKPETEEGIAPR